MESSKGDAKKFTFTQIIHFNDGLDLIDPVLNISFFGCLSALPR